MFVFGIPGFSPVRTGGLQGCQCCQGSGCALRNTNLLTHRAGDCDRQRSATSRKCFQVENSVLFFTPFSFRMRRPFFLLFFVFSVLFFLFSMLTRKVGKSTLVFLLFYVFILLLFSYSVFRFFAAQQATRLFVFVALFCFILLCSLYLPPAVFPHFLYYHAIYHFLCQTLAHSARRPTPTRALFVFRHIPAMFRGGKGRSGVYILSILFTRKLQVYEAICMRI